MKKKLPAAVLSLLLVLLPAGCGGSRAEDAELTVFAAASLTEALSELAERYQSAVPGAAITFCFDSSGTLQKQIQEGAVCDLFLAAAPEPMDALQADGLLDEATRVDLLENKIVLAVPAGNPAGISGFDGLMDRLRAGDVLLSIGGGDVPAGRYARKIFDCYGVVEADVADCLTYGSNVKEVASQTAEAAVDCGIIYATDASAAGLEVVDSATAEQCGQVLYPAAVLKSALHPAEAADFLAYLRSEEAEQIFVASGFSLLAE